MPGFGSSVTIHYYAGTDTRFTGRETTGAQIAQAENKFSRFSPQINIRYKDKIDLQAAFIKGTEDNWFLTPDSSLGTFDFTGIGVEAGYMPTMKWHFALHYDYYASDDTPPLTGPVFDFNRIVPAITYVINQNIRATVYYEKDLTDIPADQERNKLYLNIRTMF